MIILDTNVIIDALDAGQGYHGWARRQIEEAAMAGQGGVSVVTLAELCAGTSNAAAVEPEIRRFGLSVFDFPAAAAGVCGKAYRRYVMARRRSGGGSSPKIPLPDFFIGAQAEVMGWKIVTRDSARFKNYFPKVALITP